MGGENTTKKRTVDWEAVERDFRTAKFTLRELGEKHQVTHTTIGRRAEREGWSKDLQQAIRQATNAKLIAETVQQKCTTAHQDATETVIAAAEINAHVILKHRAGLRRLGDVKDVLIDQIEQAAKNLPNLAELIEMVRQPDDNGVDKANDALRKAMSRSGLVDDLKKLAEIDERVRKGEREAFAIGADSDDDENNPAKTLQALLDVVDGSKLPLAGSRKA